MNTKITKMMLLAAITTAGMTQLRAYADDPTYTWIGGAVRSGAVVNNWIRPNSGDYYPENWVGGLAPDNGTRCNIRFASDMWTGGASTVMIYLRTSTDPNVGNILFDNTSAGINLRIHYSGTNGAFLDLTPAYNGAETITVLTNGNTISAGRTDSTLPLGKIRLYANDNQLWRVGATAADTDISFTISAPVTPPDATTGLNRGFTKVGGGTLIMTSAESTFSGAVIAAEGTLQVSSLKNIGVTSALGTGVKKSMIQISQTTATERQNGALVYTGGDTTTDRAIGLQNTAFNGANITARLENANAASTLTLTGSIYDLDGITGETVDFSIGGAGKIAINQLGIWGNINLIKTGAGDVSINANGEWSGSNTVKQGRLFMNADQSDDDMWYSGGQWYVENGGTLGGKGRITTNVIVAKGGKLSPGADSADKLTVDGSVSLNGMLEILINEDGTCSKLVAGSLNLGDESGISIVADQALALGTVMTVADTNSLTGTFAGLADNAVFVSGINSFQINYLTGSGDIQLTVVESPVPEPASLAIALCGGAMLMRRRRNRQS